jgi:5-methylcytosine-specific restriction endonuclease McrA
LKPLGEQRHHLHCTLSDTTKSNLFRLAEILGIDSPWTHLDELIEKVAKIAVEARDPAQAKKSPPKAAQQSIAALNCSTSSTMKKKTQGNKKVKTNSRYIPHATRRAAYARSDYRCEYVSSDNIRCNKKTHLEIDHKFAFSLGGDHGLDNLQVFCSGHNKRKGELEFGFSHSQGYG